MSSSWLHLDPFTLCFLGLLVFGVGVTFLLTKNFSPIRRNAVVIAIAVAIAVASTELGLGSLDSSLLIGFCAIGLLSLIGSNSVAVAIHRLRSTLRQPAVKAGTLVLAGAGLLAAAAIQSEPGESEMVNFPFVADGPARTFKTISGAQATTDRGRIIPLLAPDNLDLEKVTQGEARLLESLKNANSMIRIAPIDPNVNCHGWVFAQGQYWIGGANVDTIIADNGYLGVSQPAPDDVVIYRDASGGVTHSGIVRAAWDGKVLIESKWGAQGTFLHFVEKSCYGNYYEFRRSARTTRALNVLSSPGTNPTTLSGDEEETSLTE